MMQKYTDLVEIKNTINIELLAKHAVEGFLTGLHQSPFHGFSVEFAEHRIYNSGESTRHIDWKLYSKTDKLFTKRYEEETNLRCQILIDVSESMHYPIDSKGKLTFSLFAAASIAQLLKKQRDAFGITTFAEDIIYQSPIKSTTSHLHSQFLEMQRLLDSDGIKQKSAVSKAIEAVASTMHKRSLIVIFSDMFDNVDDTEKLFSALQHLRHNKHEVLLFHVFDGKTEMNFEFENRSYEFIDVESNERVKLHPHQVKEFYLKEIQNRTEQLMLRCGQYKIDYISADINLGVEQVLNAYLLKRQKMI